MWSQYSAMAQHGELGEPVNLRPFSGSRGANRIMTVGAVSASIPIDPSARSIRLVNSGSSICYVRIGQGEQTATSADVAVFGNSEVVLSKGEGEGTLAFISASGTTLQAQTGSGGTVPGYQVVDQLFLTGDGVTQSGQLVDQFGRTVKPVGDAALTRTDWQGTVALSATARENLLTYSNTFSNDIWTKTRATLSGGEAAPDGTNTAWKHLQNAAGAGAQQTQAFLVVDGQKYTISFCFKKGNINWVAFNIANNEFTACGRRWFNVDSGALGSSAVVGGGLAQENAAITSIGNGWYRCSMTVTAIGTILRAGYYSTNADNAFAGATNDYIYVFAADAKNSIVLTSFIPTTTAPVTVTDYTLGAGGLITLGEVPVVDAQLKWSGIAIHT